MENAIEKGNRLGTDRQGSIAVIQKKDGGGLAKGSSCGN